MSQGFVNSSSGVTLSGKNLIIGGNFDTNPWQRGVSVSLAGTTSSYLADRFNWLTNNDGVVTYSQAADAPTVTQAGFFSQTCLSIATTTADASIAAGQFGCVQHTIEGYNYARVAQQAFTVSFWVKSTKTGIFTVGVQNGGGDRSCVLEYTINTSNTWEKKILTFPASPAAGTWNYVNGAGLTMYFNVAMGSNYFTTPGTWVTGNLLTTSNQVNGLDSTSNIFKLALIQVELGSQATSFDSRLQAQELLMCQRYYEKSYNFDGYPGAITNVGAVQTCKQSSLGGYGEFSVQFKASKRTQPTITIYNPTTGATGTVPQDDGSTIAMGTVSSVMGYRASYTSTAGRYGCLQHFVANAEF